MVSLLHSAEFCNILCRVRTAYGTLQVELNSLKCWSFCLLFLLLNVIYIYLLHRRLLSLTTPKTRRLWFYSVLNFTLVWIKSFLVDDYITGPFMVIYAYSEQACVFLVFVMILVFILEAFKYWWKWRILETSHFRKSSIIFLLISFYWLVRRQIHEFWTLGHEKLKTWSNATYFVG